MNFKVSALYFRNRLMGYRCTQPNGLFSDIPLSDANEGIKSNVSERLELFSYKEDGSLRSKSEIEALKHGTLKSSFSCGSTWYYISNPASEMRARMVLNGLGSRICNLTGTYPNLEFNYDSLHSILTIRLNSTNTESSVCTDWLSKYKFEYTMGVTEDSKFLLTIRC